MLNDDVKQALKPETIPSIAGSHRFQWEEVQDCHVILYPEGMVKLGDSSAEILKLCDGENNLRSIIELLQQKYPGAELENDVTKFLEIAHENGWIKYS